MRDFVTQGRMTDPGRYAGLFHAVPGDVAGVGRVVQGLLIHEFWADGYGVTLAEEDRDRVNLRRVEDVLDAVLAKDDRPLTEEREPGSRVATNCRGFSVLAVAMLRHHGVPARARCGFGAYFKAGYFEDHWVVEYRDGDTWKLFDAQIDPMQRDIVKITFDLADVPRDQFVIAGQGWKLVRAGKADPNRFGLSTIDEFGDWWIAQNLTRDAASLAGIETLPWDQWGVMPEPGDAIDVELYDRLAAATAEPSMSAVTQLMVDERLRIPGEVFNVQHQRKEPV
jgi:hypothetical protein